MRISPNYKLSEFEYSATARVHGIDNTIPPAAVNAIRILVEHLLQPINDATGWKNKISSGYRSKKLNDILPGASTTSMHMSGEAADCKFYEVNSKGKIARWVSPVVAARKVIELGLDFDQMILYPTFVHLSFTAKRKNRKQVLYSGTYSGPKL